MLVRAIYFVDIRAGDAIATLLRANSAQFTYATLIGVIVLALPRAAISKISQAVRHQEKKQVSGVQGVFDGMRMIQCIEL
jgi:hypothetical protein